MHTWIEATSYIGSALIFLAFFMRAIVPLRLAAIGSNVFFIIYAAYTGLIPILVLDLALLPLNIWRIIEYRRLERQVRAASQGAPDMAKAVPFMKATKAAAGETLFEKGDAASQLYYLEEGRVRLEEVGVEIGPGALLGEIALFLDDAGRTATATCITDCRMRTLNRKQVEELVMMDPGFGLFLTKLIARRQTDNLEATRAALA